MGPAPGEPIRVREIWPSGTVIKGDYVVDKKLGSGGFGTVYLARHRYFGTSHVIKRLHEQYASDEEYVRKFMNEGRAVRRLKGCPYIVEVEHMTQSEDGHLILVMEYVAGGDLMGVLETRTLTVEEVIAAGRQIALGLVAAHGAGLIHRDIKPQNILVSNDAAGRPLLKLIDFGLAKDHQSDEKTSVMRGGSLGYTAPEQWMQSGKHLDGRTDLYSLGATMYRMLCGRMPFETDGEIWTWLAMVMREAPAAPVALRADCPAALSDLVLELLAPSPEGRPKDAATVVRRLEGIGLQAPGPQALPEPPIIRAQPEVGKPRKRLGVLAAGLAVLAAGAGLGGWMLSGGKSPEIPKIQEKNLLKAALPGPAPQIPWKEPEKKAAKQELAVPERKVEVDYAAQGDAARDSGDLQAALGHYRKAKDRKRLEAAQRAIEGEAEERASGLMDQGRYPEALRLVDSWVRQLPESLRLTALRKRIERARDSQ